MKERKVTWRARRFWMLLAAGVLMAELWYTYRNATPQLRKRVFAADCIQFVPGTEGKRLPRAFVQ